MIAAAAAAPPASAASAALAALAARDAAAPVLPEADEGVGPAGLPGAPAFLEALVRRAEAAGASDIHLHRTGSEATVALRLDGVLSPSEPLPRGLAERLFGRVKYLARLKTYVESLPQDGRINRQDLGSASDLRVATYPTVAGEKIVLRLFREAEPRPLGELGFGEAGTEALIRFLGQGAGLLLLTGPAGSGKTTTIHACLAAVVAEGGRHVITIEDPVEQVLAGVMQTEVNEARGLSFAAAARHLLRQDPQVLVIGEIRDEETAGVAVRAALTGHLMIATLHAGSCRGVWDRLSTLCPETSAAVSALDLIWNQRLVRRTCPACAGQLRAADDGGAVCGLCLGTGFRGRLPLAEWVRVDDALRRRLRLEGSGVLEPGTTLETAGENLLARGLTTATELERMLRR